MKKALFLVSIFSFFIISNTFANDSLLKLAESGNPEAQFKVAAMYATGKLGNKTTEDREKMFEWLEKAADQDFLKAQEILCKQYLDRCNYSKALKWAKKAMDKKSNIGKSVMAYLLYYGENVIPIDKNKAYSLIKECDSEPLAKTLLANFYSEGWFDFEINLDKAEELAKEAIQQKCSKAYGVLNFIYLKKYFIEPNKDIIKKMKDFTDEGIKMNPFDYEIQLYKPMLLIMFPESEDEQKEGVELAKKYAMNNKEAYLILSEYEMSVNKDPKKALEYLEKTEEDYCSDSAYKLFELYVMGENDKGIKIEKNPSKAREIALKAISFNNQKFLEKYIPIYKMAKTNEAFKNMLGEAFIEDFDEVKYIKIAADNGSPAMMYLYSKSHHSSDIKKYRIGAANMGWADAQADLSLKSLKTKKYEEAYNWALKADKQFNYAAQYVIGHCMLLGLGNCNQDVEQGFKNILNSMSNGFYLFVSGDYDFSGNGNLKKDSYKYYLLQKIYADSAVDTEFQATIRSQLPFLKKDLTNDEIEKADKLAEKIIKYNKNSQETIHKIHLSVYGEYLKF